MSHEPTSRIESLLKLAGERDQPSTVAVERARAAAQASWQRALDADAEAPERARPRARFGLALALAASVIAAVTAAFWLWTPHPPAVDVARVTVVSGEARLVGSGATVFAAAPM